MSWEPSNNVPFASSLACIDRTVSSLLVRSGFQFQEEIGFYPYLELQVLHHGLFSSGIRVV